MPIPSALLDFATLLEPIPGDNPAGTAVPFQVRHQLEDFRKEDNPDDYAPDDPLRPEKFRKADWPGIIRLAQDTLTHTSKDLLVAVRLAEASDPDSPELLQGRGASPQLHRAAGWPAPSAGTGRPMLGAIAAADRGRRPGGPCRTVLLARRPGQGGPLPYHPPHVTAYLR